MRILAIRGCNLASLAGEFELDLAGAVLGGAGVFAIVGNTGAGKSTLLDAMCVALFDRTPRLCAPSRVQVGRGPDDPLALGASDVRTLLRRGAAAGYAEVDFESGDARRYRARWTVRRARNRGDGTLQDQQLTLVAIDGGERLGGTKTETLRAIQQRLGLSFEQFRRSALLAQGEFAAFLRSESKDRSELLERMTGTEIYSRLSIAAHQRAALADTRLRDARAAAMAIAVLADEARATGEAARAVAMAAQGAARARHAAAGVAASWLGEAARREAARAAAEGERAAAQAAETAAEALRAELALRRRAEALRPIWDEASRVDRALAIAHAEASAADEGAGRARAIQAAIAERRTVLATQLAPIRAARIAAGLVERPAGGGGAPAGATEDAAWLRARAALAPEIAAWAQLDGKLAQHAATTDALVALDSGLATLGERRASGARAHADAKAAHGAALTAHGEAQRKAEKFRDRRGLTLDAARRLEDAARERGKEVDGLVAIAAGARDAARARGELDAQLAELLAVDAADGAAASAAREAQAESRVMRDERARAVAELRRAAGYEHARAELVDGEPCPLCGADEHPWRDRGAFDDVIRDADARLAEAGARFDAAGAALATLAARGPQRERERTRLTGHRAKADDAATAAVGAWRDRLASLGELLLVDDPGSAAAAALAKEREDAARAALDAARATRGEAEGAAKATSEAQAQVLARQADVDQQARRLAELERSQRDLDAAIERQRGERAVQAEHGAALAAAIELTVARWRAAAPADLARGVALRTQLTALADLWRRRAEVVAQADAALAAALAVSDGEAREAERTVAELSARHADAVARREAGLAELAAVGARLAAARVASGFEADELRRLLAAEPARVHELVELIAARARAVALADALVAERARLVAEHAAACTSPAEALADAAQVPELAAAATAADARAAKLAAELMADADASARRDAALAAIGAEEQAVEVDRVLGDVIGSHDGKLFRSFAQSLTLDALLAVANSHLEELAPRYQLERVPRHDLELQVIDRDLGGEVRSVQSLSGGESFLVSLALALGLSSMSAQDVRVRTLLIDEGFGTLDPSTLDSALAVLDRLQATGRQVGVISHVPALVERVGAHVRIVQRGGGRSEVIVAEA